MKCNSIFRLVSTVVLSSTIAQFSISTAQAAECKGLTQDKCTAAEGCAWVASYTTKAGKTIAAYCRNKTANKEGSEKDKESAEAASDAKDAKKAK